ncbi:MAG TPA: hypothetical protein DD856_10580 [Sulfobacillus sp.]|nr:hypothetical protein [Sulfobacillus sp.]
MGTAMFGKYCLVPWCGLILRSWCQTRSKVIGRSQLQTPVDQGSIRYSLEWNGMIRAYVKFSFYCFQMDVIEVKVLQ